MKEKRTQPLNLTGEGPDFAEPPMAHPDHDLDLPGPNPASMSSTSSPLVSTRETATPTASTAADMSPAVSPLPSTRVTTRTEPRLARHVYLIAALVSVLWLALAFFALGYQLPAGFSDLRPLQTAIFVVLGVAPVGFIWLFAYALDQGSRLAREIERARRQSDTWSDPIQQAAGETNIAVLDIRREIEAAVSAAAGARSELSQLRDVLAEETGRLSAATAESARTARALGDTLGHEREELSALARVLDSQAVAVTDAVARQAKMVTDASDLAQAQIGEAEAALAARAADLAAAAGEASDAARIASEDLSRQALRIETATGGVSDQTRALEETLTQQRAALVATAHELRGDSEDFAVHLESQRAQVADMLGRARSSVTDINEAAAHGSEALRELADLAATQARDMHETTTSRIHEITEVTANRMRELADTAREERDLLSAGALQSVGAVTEAARYERDALAADARRTLDLLAEAAEEAHRTATESSGAINQVVRHEREQLEADTRQALDALAQAAEQAHQAALESSGAIAAAVRAERGVMEAETRNALQALADAAGEAHQVANQHARAARMQVEALSEAAFSAGQKAEAAYQQRMEEAQGLIAHSANLVDQAAGKSAERLEVAASNARTVLAALESAVEEVESRVTRLPQEATAQAAAMKEQLAHSFDDLLASARNAAQETQAIDQAFQERVKRNYEMLSEAVRLMGLMSSPTARASLRPASGEVAAAGAPTEGAKSASPPPRRSFLERPGAPSAAPAPAGSPSSQPPPTQSPGPADASGLRPRLRFAPTRADEEVSNVFSPAQEPAAPGRPAEAEGEGGWTWQELLTSMDDGPISDDQVADRLIGEVEGLGVDLLAILPEQRLHEIAGVLHGGDAAGARLVVRHLAPAAVRRLSRRAMTEPPLRAHAERFVQSYGAGVAAAGAQGQDAVASLLSNERGRTWLLFDTALSELP